MRILLCCLTFALTLSGQSWTGILASSRGLDWTGAGLPATLPTGETTTKPWIPPTRTQCVTAACNTVSVTGTVTFATINAALASAPAGTYVLVPAGTYTLNGTGGCSSGNSSNITFYAQNGVTLRGVGAQGTIINLGTDGSTAAICFGIAWSTGAATVSSGLSQGSTSMVVSSVSGGGGLTVGELIQLSQCNDGLSGVGCGTGSASDTGGIFNCARTTVCAQQITTGSTSAQSQVLLVTAIVGTTITFSPPLYMPNWTTSQNATISWNNAHNGGGVPAPNSNGLEDMTINATGNGFNAPIVMSATYACWIKGVRVLGIGTSFSVNISGSKNALFANNYIYAALGLGGADNTMLEMGNDSDSLVINNMLTGGVVWEGGGRNSGNVVSYSYAQWANTTYYQGASFEHQAGSTYHLFEGNQIPKENQDNTFGTHNLETQFRNYLSGADPPFIPAGGTGTAFGLGIGAFSRMSNAIGNVIGSAQVTNYQSTIASPQATPVFIFNSGGPPTDTLTETTYMRWGNCDTVTATCRFQSSEVPTTLTGAAIPYQNTVPGNNNLPCSFFLTTSTTCTAFPSGGTGLSWWKVCTTWTTFPTACGATSVPPFPFAGPDVSGGLYVNAHSYDNPAALAFKSLPIDNSLQNTYAVSSSSWSGGVETLTFAGAVLPSTSHLIGPFQINGGACATSGAGTATGAEVIVTATTATTVQYALVSNPGSCAGGSMLFPDVRQFDERVFQNDPLGAASSRGMLGASKMLGTSVSR